MSQVRHAPTVHVDGKQRSALHLVGYDPLGYTAHIRTPGSSLAWARAYRSKLRLTDCLIVIAATLCALIAPSWLSSPGHSPIDSGSAQWAVSGVIVLSWITVMGSFRTRDRRIVGVGAGEYKRVITASTMTFGLLAISFLVLDETFARKYLIVTLPLGIVALVISRWLWRRWLARQRRFGHYLTRAIVVGNRDDIEYVAARIDEKMGTAYTIVGIVHDDPHSDTTPTKTGVRVYRGLDTVASTAAALHADAVIIAGQPSAGNDFIRNLAWQLEGTAAELVLASRLANVAGPRIHFRPVEGLPLIHVEIPQFEGGKHVIKRALDIVVSAVMLPLLMPLFLVLAILIRVDSPGPVLFRQQRVGRNGRTFQMVKFRTMIPKAEDQQGSLFALNEGAGMLFKIKDDPRVTRIGRVLRKYSLDELPQFWNVLVGEMSLVGPRPPLPREALGYEGAVHRRLYIKPGLTGMWQINGRSDLNWEDSVRLDLYYVENWSLVGDLVIMWRTLRVLLRPVGAY
jgi:exopolysaccharide biosynthesis polyprenyl glycosylphosphotransferase